MWTSSWLFPPRISLMHRFACIPPRTYYALLVQHKFSAAKQIDRIAALSVYYGCATHTYFMYFIRYVWLCLCMCVYTRTYIMYPLHDDDIWCMCVCVHVQASKPSQARMQIISTSTFIASSVQRVDYMLYLQHALKHPLHLKSRPFILVFPLGFLYAQFISWTG